MVIRLLSLVFLGTGGGRFATIRQTRATGGLYLYSDSTRLHIDPGPGALIRLKECGIDPTKTTAIIVTHNHPDHYNDAEILIEAMTHGCKKKKGIFAASESVLNGFQNLGPSISKYHSSKPLRTEILRPGTTLELDRLMVRTTRTAHSDATAFGLRMESSDGALSMTGDTALKEELFEDHRDATILVLSVTRPLNSRIPHHLSTEDAAELVKAIKPKLAVLTHFGAKFVSSNPEVQANWVERKSGVRTISAWDGMTVTLKSGECSVEKCISRERKDSRKIPEDLDDIIPD